MFEAPRLVRNEFNSGIDRLDLTPKNLALKDVIDVKFGAEEFILLYSGTFRYLADEGFSETTLEDILKGVNVTLRESSISNELRSSAIDLGTFGVHATINFNEQLKDALGEDLAVHVTPVGKARVVAGWDANSKDFLANLTHLNVSVGDLVKIEILFKNEVIMSYEKEVV